MIHATDCARSESPLTHRRRGFDSEIDHTLAVLVFHIAAIIALLGGAVEALPTLDGAATGDTLRGFDADLNPHFAIGQRDRLRTTA